MFGFSLMAHAQVEYQMPWRAQGVRYGPGTIFFSDSSASKIHPAPIYFMGTPLAVYIGPPSGILTK